MAVIVEDTRQHAGKHEAKHAWFEAHGVAVVRRKLDFGDYATDSSNVCVDTKKGLSEVAQNLGRDHARFSREADRACEAGFRLVVLVEQAGPYHQVEDVARWVCQTCARCIHRRTGMCSPASRCVRFRRRPISGTTLMKMMMSMQATRGVSFELVHPSRAASRICELLGVICDGDRQGR